MSRDAEPQVSYKNTEITSKGFISVIDSDKTEAPAMILDIEQLKALIGERNGVNFTITILPKVKSTEGFQKMTNLLQNPKAKGSDLLEIFDTMEELVYAFHFNAINIPLEENNEGTFFMKAVYIGNEQIVSILLLRAMKYGIALNAKDNLGRTAFHIACIMKHFEIMKAFFERPTGIDFNRQDHLKFTLFGRRGMEVG